MPYGETKVYHDGSHYIAIPHTTRPNRRGTNTNILPTEKTVQNPERAIEPDPPLRNTETTTGTVRTGNEQPATAILKDIFEALYKEHSDKRKSERKASIVTGLSPYFGSESKAKEFADIHLERKRRNTIVRRTRLARKINLQEFNYFCTFTYDDMKHTELTFRQKLSNCFKHLSNRKGWKYIGVWERSPAKKRLHFHGIFYIPDGTMPGDLEEHNDYSFITRSRQITMQNTYFNKRFGRSDFEPIDDRRLLSGAASYLMKYIEKSGERLVYSKGLPTYFISDIMDEDVICTIGQEDRKLLLFDDFNCWDEGCLMGQVSAAVITELRKSN